MTLDQLMPALIQLPFLGIFVWFAIKLMSDFRKDATVRDDNWRGFLDDERKQRMDAMNMGLQEVKHLANGMAELANGVGKLAEGVAAHDAKATERASHLLREIEKVGERNHER